MAKATPSRRLVVIGASAGGIPALMEIVGALRADFPAPICIVLHIGAYRSHLPHLFSARGANPARHASDGEPLLPGSSMSRRRTAT